MPSKKTSNERTEQIHLRVTPEEKKEIEDRAKKSGKTVARYLVGLSTTRHIVNPSRLCQLIFQIKRAGVNINEIVTVANTNKFANAEMIARVEQQEKEIQKLLHPKDSLFITQEKLSLFFKSIYIRKVQSSLLVNFKKFYRNYLTFFQNVCYLAYALAAEL